jgi:hypothetical protein
LSIKLVLLLPFLFAAQGKSPEKCGLAGTVVNSVTGEPLKKVQILAEPLGKPGAPAYGTLSDDNGNFKLVELDPGQYKVKGERNGYLPTSYGGRRADSTGAAVVLEPGQQLLDLKLKMPPFGVIAGTARESDGDPVAGARVELLRVDYSNGYYPRAELIESANTDDSGQYRSVNLPPGKYYVRVTPRDSSFAVDGSPKSARRLEVLVPTLYPGVQDPLIATLVEVTPGARVTGIGVILSRKRLFRVSGYVPFPAQADQGSVVLSCANGISGVLEQVSGVAVQKADGKFEIEGVPPGSYQLSAVANGRDRFYFGHLPIEVGDADVQGVRIMIDAGTEVTGRVTLGGAAVAKFNPALFLTDGSFENRFTASVGPDQTFGVNLSQSRSRYQISLPKDGPLFIQSVRSGGTDVLREGLAISGGGKVELEVVLSADAGQVDGVVLDKDDNPSVGARVLLAPEPKLRSRPDLVQTAISDQQGHYRFQKVPPGNYTLFAWDDLEPGIWWDPDFLKKYETQGEPAIVSAHGRATVKQHLLAGPGML